MTNTLFFRKLLLVIGDILLLYLSLLLALVIRSFGHLQPEFFFQHLPPFTILYLLWLAIFYILGLYDFSLFQELSAFSARICLGLGLSLATGTSFFYLIPSLGISPKTTLFLNILVFGILIFAWRRFFYFIFSSHFQTQVAIVGKNASSEELAKSIQKNPHFGYKLTAFLDPKKDILKQIRENKIDTIVMAENLELNSSLTKKLYQCLPLKVNLIDLPRAYEMIFEKIPVSSVSQVWLLENIKEKNKDSYEKMKRAIDLVLSSLLLLATLPLWLVIALLIKLEDKGPVFYKQKRVGKNKKEFYLWKFRSMTTEAEKKTGAVWAKEKDPRITKIGGLLRQTHLDELPQMLNIIKGDISLVGPRPERPEFVKKLEKEIPYYHLRHLIKPGFTGWAQIKFRYARSVMDSFEKFQYDLYYLKNRSLFLDTKILLKTFQLFFKRER